MARISFKPRGSALDLALAAFAGAAFAFAAFAMPEWRLTQLSLATGLADIFPPARPPLGFTARVLFAVAVGTVAAGGSLLLLRLAERKPVAKRETTEADAPPEPIRLRRADAHPDAPARRPLVARDLGEPVETPLLLAAPEAPRDEEWLLAPDAELPAFLVEQEPEPADAEPVVSETADAEPEAPLVWPQPVIAPAPEPEPVAPAEPEATQEPEAEVEPQAEPAPIPEPAPAPVVAEEPAAQPEAEPSISKLMQRLEFGIARRERAAPLDPAAVAAPADDAVGHRLRSAIGDLKKLAARG
jgi:hypothetical protein